MRSPEEVARDADALVPWRRVWTIVGIAVVVLVGGLCWFLWGLGGLAD
ncbi:MAG: hypothetical protein QNJ90_03510 [Planctomycetota bacterium]|nr:hypothetical protein [Planctomycetota bacterium]